MAAMSDGKKESGQTFSLREFTESFDLPKWVSVVGGKDTGSEQQGSTRIQKGDILLLRTLAVESVTLSFNDTDTGNKRLVQVSSDCQVKFHVLLPFPDFKKSGPKTVYPTVADLLKVCPTYFQANIFYDDPYLPAIVKSGEVFRFMRQIRNTTDRRIYLQCEDADGNIIELPDECRGDFTAVEDERPYTLKEILDLGCVTRKLKLANDRRKLSLTSAAGNVHDGENFYKNVSGSKSGDALHRIMGLPVTYTGLITFHKPNMFLAVSPSTCLTEAWKVPLDLDVTVKRYIPEDYEKPDRPPVQRMYKLAELLNTFIEDLPVLATLVHYKDMPADFMDFLKPGDDVIIHKIEREDKLLAKSDSLCYCISRKLQGRFRQTLRKAYCFDDLKQLREGRDEVLFKIMQDVASDFPVPYSLQAGECLRIKSFDVKKHKLKTKSKTFGPFDVLQCERMTEKGVYQKILLPDDLEVFMHEIPSKEAKNGYSAAELFLAKPTMPHSVDYLADYTNVWSCLPVCSEISLNTFVTEPLAIVSVVPSVEGSSRARTCMEAKVKTCFAIPSRHHAMFTVKESLGFPASYFKFPDRNEYITVPVEKISKTVYDDLVRHNDMAYEEYEVDPESPCSASNMEELELPIRSRKSSEPKVGTINQRLSRSLSNLFKPKTKSKPFKLKKKKKEEIKGTDITNSVSNQTYGTQSDEEEQHYNDEDIYETYDFPKTPGSS